MNDNLFSKICNEFNHLEYLDVHIDETVNSLKNTFGKLTKLRKLEIYFSHLNENYENVNLSEQLKNANLAEQLKNCKQIKYLTISFDTMDENFKYNLTNLNEYLPNCIYLYLKY